MSRDRLASGSQPIYGGLARAEEAPAAAPTEARAEAELDEDVRHDDSEEADPQQQDGVHDHVVCKGRDGCSQEEQQQGGEGFGSADGPR